MSIAPNTRKHAAANIPAALVARTGHRDSAGSCRSATLATEIVSATDMTISATPVWAKISGYCRTNATPKAGSSVSWNPSSG